jgi:hypothetical protein
MLINFVPSFSSTTRSWVQAGQITSAIRFQEIENSWKVALEAIDLADPSGKGGLEQSQVALFRKFLGRDRQLGLAPRFGRILFTLGA